MTFDPRSNIQMYKTKAYTYLINSNIQNLQSLSN